MDYDDVRDNLNEILQKIDVEITTNGKKEFLESEFDNNLNIRSFEQNNHLKKWSDFNFEEQRKIIEFLRPYVESYDGEQQLVADLILQCMDAPGYSQNKNKVSELNESGVYYIARQRVLKGNDYAKSFEELDKLTAE